MIRTTEKLLVLLVCTSLAACTTLRNVPDWQALPVGTQTADTQGLKAGDHIMVTTTSNLTAELDFVGLTADNLEGTAGKEKQLVQIPRNQVAHVERQEVSAAKTTGYVLGVTAITLLALLGIAVGSGAGYAMVY